MILYAEIAAGEYLGGEDSPVRPRTLQRWRLEGRGPKYIKVGRLVRYPRDELDAFLVANLRQSTSEQAEGAM